MGDCCCVPQCRAAKFLIAGIAIIAAYYMNWSIWLVIGILLVIKGASILIWPECPCDSCKVESKKKR